AQLKRVQSVEVQQEATREYLQALLAKDGPYGALKELSSLRKRMEYRMNPLVGVILNMTLAWDFQVVSDFDKWSRSHAGKLMQWEEALARLEVWVSGGCYRFNHPESVFAELIETQEFQMLQLGHPFVRSEKQVRNDFELSATESFHIITGPNMAGKSTFLRSVGLAILSANAGFPVLAVSCRLPRMCLYSSMRTSDDLTVESSYF